MEYVHFRDLVSVCYTEEEVKEVAAAYSFSDEPDETGVQSDRTGKLMDPFPRPYSNKNEGRYVNGGAYPPDLSLMTRARKNGDNYVFALLTGYQETPAGIK